METEVYFVAVNMMDRMMMKLFFKREHFQLLAAASLLIASKLKETLPIQPDKVIIYTDNSISFEDLIVSMNWGEIECWEEGGILSILRQNNFFNIKH